MVGSLFRDASEPGRTSPSQATVAGTSFAPPPSALGKLRNIKGAAHCKIALRMRPLRQSPQFHSAGRMCRRAHRHRRRRTASDLDTPACIGSLTEAHSCPGGWGFCRVCRCAWKGSTIDGPAVRKCHPLQQALKVIHRSSVVEAARFVWSGGCSLSSQHPDANVLIADHGPHPSRGREDLLLTLE